LHNYFTKFWPIFTILSDAGSEGIALLTPTLYVYFTCMETKQVGSRCNYHIYKFRQIIKLFVERAKGYQQKTTERTN